LALFQQQLTATHAAVKRKDEKSGIKMKAVAAVFPVFAFIALHEERDRVQACTAHFVYVSGQVLNEVPWKCICCVQMDEDAAATEQHRTVLEQNIKSLQSARQAHQAAKRKVDAKIKKLEQLIHRHSLSPRRPGTGRCVAFRFSVLRSILQECC
jgi:hypothetical protein